jgi:dTDP-4-amino-4,6-dideoxygalactose transaminase
VTPEREIPVFVPYLGPEIRAAIEEALDVGWLGMGAATGRFEDEVAGYLGLTDRKLVAVNTGTNALHCAFVLAGVGPGDEVVCPSFTYVAGHQAVSMTGADVVFSDIEERTLAIDPESIRSVLGERTKAILVVHFAGIAADLDPILELAREHGLRLVEDAAEAFGTRYKGRLIGSFGDLAALSFDPVKVVTALDAGAVVTPHEEDEATLQQLRLLGVNRDTADRVRNRRMWEYDVVRQGFRYHLGAIPASIGLAQLRLVDTFIENRRRYCRRYSEAFADLPDVETPPTDFEDVSSFIYFVRVPAEARADLMAHLSERGIGTGIHFIGAHHFSYYRDCRRADLSVTERVSAQEVTLPLWSFMDDDVLERVIDGVRSFFRG